MAKRRNVLLIVCDQLRADFIGPYGGPAAVTPRLNAVAADSAVFDKAYSVKPLCVAARMTLLTGRHPVACPVRIPPSVPTVAETLSRAGYHTAAFGKMHMTPPRGPYGFAELVLAEDTGPGVFLDDFHRFCAERGYVEWPHGLDNYDILSVVNPLGEEQTATAWTGRQAIEFIERQTPGSAPFYAVVSFTKPHPPYDPPMPWAALVPPADAPAPVGLGRPWQDYPALVRKWEEAFGSSSVQELGLVQQVRAHYLGLVGQIDDHVGRILDALAGQGLAEQTLLIFTSDHGDFLGDHGLFMKFHPYEASAKIPLLVRGAGLPAGRFAMPVSHLDVVPTVLDYCGVAPPADLGGKSLLELAATAGPGRDGVLIETCRLRGFCWAERRWKYILWPNDEEELFDLAEDPHEERNLIGSRSDLRRPVRAALIAELQRHEAVRDASLPPLLEGGRPLTGIVQDDTFAGLSRRFIHHRLPRRPPGDP